MELEKMEQTLYNKIIEIADRDWSLVISLDEAEEMYEIVQTALNELGEAEG